MVLVAAPVLVVALWASLVLTVALLAVGPRGTFTSALWETEALAAEAEDSQEEGDRRLPGGLSHPPHLPSTERPAVCSPV